MVTPSAAVTRTDNTFSPVARSLSPEISTVASRSVVSTVTSTSVVPGSRSTTSPSATSFPSTWNTAREVSMPKRTLRVTKYSEVFSPSAEVTVTTRMFSPG